MRSLGNTDIIIKRVGFGGIPIQRITQYETNKVVDELERQGINFILQQRVCLEIMKI